MHWKSFATICICQDQNLFVSTLLITLLEIFVRNLFCRLVCVSFCSCEKKCVVEVVFISCESAAQSEAETTTREEGSDQDADIPQTAQGRRARKKAHWL